MDVLCSLQGIINHLQGVLKKYPPPSPTEPAVRLVEAMGLLQARAFLLVQLDLHVASQGC